jgi:hypothetical protein
MPETVLTQPADNQPVVETAAPPVETAPEAAPAAETPAPGDWRAALPEDLRGEKMFENIKGKDAAEALPALAKGYRDAQKLVGGSLGKIPAKDAKPEEVEAWKTANLPKLREAGLIEGPPEDPSKYNVKFIRNGEPVEVTSTSMYAFNKLAFDMGLSPKQAQGMADAYMAQQQSLGGSVKDTMALLNKEWGAGAPVQIKAAQQAVAQVGGQELLDVLETTGLGNHPALIKAFARVGAVLAEDDPVFADTVRSGDGEAKAARAKIMSDKTHAYWNSDHAGHKAAVAEVARLNQIIFAQEG